MDSKVILFCSLSILFSCARLKQEENSGMPKKPDCSFPTYANEQQEKIMDTRKWVIYKTKNDYSNLVPIQLSEDKQTIIAYPAPEDLVQHGNKNAIQLKNGYLIDLVGVSKNTVFTVFTLDAYQKMQTPSLDDFKKNIIDINPFSEMYVCNHNYTISEIEKIINDSTFSSICSKVK